MKRTLTLSNKDCDYNWARIKVLITITPRWKETFSRKIYKLSSLLNIFYSLTRKKKLMRDTYFRTLSRQIFLVVSMTEQVVSEPIVGSSCVDWNLRDFLCAMSVLLYSFRLIMRFLWSGPISWLSDIGRVQSPVPLDHSRSSLRDLTNLEQLAIRFFPKIIAIEVFT